MSEAKKNVTTANTVHADAIWRQLIHFELHTANNWERNWGFLKAEDSSKSSKDESTAGTVKLPPLSNGNNSGKTAKSNFPSKMPEGLAGDDEILQSFLYTYNVPKVMAYRSPQDKYHYPCTTSSQIGWKWKSAAAEPGKNSKSFYTLEKYGNYARGAGDVLKWYGGCIESLP